MANTCGDDVYEQLVVFGLSYVDVFEGSLAQLKRHDGFCGCGRHCCFSTYGIKNEDEPLLEYCK